MREATCPGCGELLGVPDGAEGGQIRCGACDQIIETDSLPAPRAKRVRPDDAPRPRRRRFRSDDPIDKPKVKSKLWIWFVLAAVLIVFLGGGAVCGGIGYWYKSVSDPKWAKFTPPDNRWSADFPGRPDLEVTPLADSPGDFGTSYEAQRLIAHESYMVGYTDYKPAELAATTLEDTVNFIVDWLAKGPYRAREKSRRNVVMSGYAAIEIVSDVDHAQFGRGRMIERYLFAGNRRYTLSTVKWGNLGQPPEFADRFFNSFTVIGRK